jgi:hypothetical protein
MLTKAGTEKVLGYSATNSQRFYWIGGIKLRNWKAKRHDVIFFKTDIPLTFRQLGMLTMADKERLESLRDIEEDLQIEERTRLAMETYVNWLEKAMSASPWTNVDLNKKLLSHATENVAAAVGLVERLSHAKSLEEVVKIQTEFVSKQLGFLNDQTKTIVEICAKAAQVATNRSN